MVDLMTAVIITTILGAAGGFLSSWMAFNASGEVFSGRKHGNALITGVLTGLALGAAVTIADPEKLSNAALFLIGITTFLSAVGIDRLRSSGSDMVANNASKTETVKPA